MNPYHFTEKSSAVCLDAAVVKRIRENRRLTQLYISKVVGVTTDTVSRWENNRYPTIRRENALKLAEALEVSLDVILLKPAEESSETESAVRKTSPILWLFLSLLVLAAVLIAFPTLYKPTPLPVSVTATRVLPNFAGPGSTVPVQVNLTHRTQSGGVILREYFPKGWKLVEAFPPASSLDNINGVARWIIKAGDDRDRVVYLVQVEPAAKANSVANFQGDIIASREGNQSAIPIQGESKMTVAPFHWADSDGNGRIDDGEMLEGSFTIEDMAGVHLDWHDLEMLWDGESYQWDARKKQFVPKAQKP